MTIRKATVYALGEFSNRIGKALAVFLLAYGLTKEQYGIYTYILALGGILVALFDAGLNTLVVLRASVHRFAKVFIMFAIAKLITIVIGVVVFCSVGLTTPALGNMYFAVLLPLMLLSLLLDLQAFLGNALRARLDYFGDALVKLIASAGFLILLVVAILSHAQMTAVSALWSQVVMIGFAVIPGAQRIWAARANLNLPGSHAGRGVRSVLAISLPFAVSTFGASFFNTIDTILLGSLSHFDANATFSLVHRIGLMTHLPIGILGGFLLPYLTAQLGKRQTKLSERGAVDRMIVLATLAGLGVSQVFVVGVEYAFVPIFGNKYVGAGHLTLILSLYVVPIYVYTILSLILTASRFIFSPSLLFAVATLFSAGLGFLVISNFQPLDIAYVSVLSNWLLMFAFCSLYRYRMGYWPLRSRTAVLILLAGVCSLLLNLSAPGALNSTLRITLALGGFAGAFTLFSKNSHLLTSFVRL